MYRAEHSVGFSLVLFGSFNGTSLEIARVAGGRHQARADALAARLNAAEGLLTALKRMLDESPFISDADTCECGDGDGRDDAGNVCEHIQARRAIAEFERSV